MRFEQVKKERKDNKAQKLIERFLSSNYDRVEVFNEDDYADNKRMTAALRFAVKKNYPDIVQVKHTNDRVYLSKISKTISH